LIDCLIDRRLPHDVVVFTGFSRVPTPIRRLCWNITGPTKTALDRVTLNVCAASHLDWMKEHNRCLSHLSTWQTTSITSSVTIVSSIVWKWFKYLFGLG